MSQVPVVMSPEPTIAISPFSNVGVAETLPAMTWERKSDWLWLMKLAKVYAYGPETCLDSSGLLALTVHSLIHGTVVNGNQITSIRPPPDKSEAKELDPAARGAGNTT